MATKIYLNTNRNFVNTESRLTLNTKRFFKGYSSSASFTKPALNQNTFGVLTLSWVFTGRKLATGKQHAGRGKFDNHCVQAWKTQNVEVIF